jgi:hypothetical protein
MSVTSVAYIILFIMPTKKYWLMLQILQLPPPPPIFQSSPSHINNHSSSTVLKGGDPVISNEVLMTSTLNQSKMISSSSFIRTLLGRQMKENEEGEACRKYGEETDTRLWR